MLDKKRSTGDQLLLETWPNCNKTTTQLLLCHDPICNSCHEQNVCFWRNYYTTRGKLL